MKPKHDTFFRQMVSRTIRRDYLENVTGFALLFLQPLMLLAVYTFVFTMVFKERATGAYDVGFVPYLAVAFWPWIAFSESVVRASGSVRANAALIGKVAVPVAMIPLSMVTATFLMNLAGYAAVLLIMVLSGATLHLVGLLATIPLLLMMFLFACALALFLGALQVFLRDVAKVLPPLMTFWFFATPILYASEMLPPSATVLNTYNPMAWYIEHIRNFILLGDLAMTPSDALVPALTIVLLWLAYRFFDRVSSHFEDFL